MALRRCLLVLLLVAAGFVGCVDPPETREPLAVVTVEGTLVEEGPDREEYACGRPLFTAGLDRENERLTILDDQGPEDPFRLGLWEDVVAVHAGNWSACEWPTLIPSPDGQVDWTLSHQSYERTFDLALDGETLRLDGAELAAGQTQEVAIDASAAEGDDSYTYRGNLTFTFHGLWPAESLEVVEDEADLRGARGTIGPLE